MGVGVGVAGDTGGEVTMGVIGASCKAVTTDCVLVVEWSWMWREGVFVGGGGATGEKERRRERGGLSPLTLFVSWPSAGVS